MFRKSKLALAALVLASTVAVGSAQAAVVVVKDNTNVSIIPGLTGFSTTGAMMAGLSVTATFSGGLSQTLLWSTTGASSGGVAGNGWGLSLDGDSFNAFWQFVISPNADLGQLVTLVLDGTNALTVLDTTNPNQGTPDSAQGADFALTILNDATATYTNVVAVSPNDPIGDLFQVLTVSFGDGGPRESFTFRQDTDNDSRFGRVPEPGTLALLGLGLAGFAAARRRKH